MMTMTASFISVIIATRNREALLAWTLDALAAQRWPRTRFEIVIADNGSSDGTKALVDSAAAKADSPSIQYLFVAEPGKSHAVNAAITIARGNLLAFTDDDVRPHPDWLKQIDAAMTETGADFLAGRVLPIWEVPPPSWVSPKLHGVLAIPDNGDRRLDITLGGGPGVIPIGANMAVRRAAVDLTGGLRVDLGKLEGSLRTGEDHEFFLRLLHAGCRGVYEPSALVRHWVPANRLTRSYFRRWLYQNGRDVARLEASYPPPSRRLFGVPRHLWRYGAGDAWLAAASLTGRDGRRFAAITRLGWLAGYVREAWFGGKPPGDSASPETARGTRSATAGPIGTLGPALGKNRWR